MLVLVHSATPAWNVELDAISWEENLNGLGMGWAHEFVIMTPNAYDESDGPWWHIWDKPPDHGPLKPWDMS